jgi:large subunit ribosomal protein L5
VSKETQGAEGVSKDAEGAVVKGAEAPAKAHKGPEGGSKAAEGGSKQQKQHKGADGAAKGEGAPKGDKPPRGEKQAKGQKGGGGEEKAKAPIVKDPPGYKPRLKVMYLETVAKDLKEEFAYKSVMQIPKLSKIIVSTGLGEAITNKKLLDSASAEISQITGRRTIRTKAKKSIANFKVRKDMDLGVMVTLRGNVMYEFLDRLINVAMPRIKDFRGANPNAFDGHGNYSLGVTEQIIFPEIDYDKIERVSGMNIAVVTSAKTDQEARSLLARLGMPFRK